MSGKKVLLFLLVVFVALGGCKKSPTAINLEQVNTPSAQTVLTPGMNSVGLIRDGKVFVYYLSEDRIWVLDKDSQFTIPAKNNGLLTPGMGTLAVLHKDKLYFYNMDASMRWDDDYELTMPIAKEFQRLSAMKMPFQRGVIALEDTRGVIHFYYLDEKKQWQTDETATFVKPEGIDNYVMMGNMDVAIISDNKLGIYQLGFSGQWQFQDDMVLSLPPGTEAVLSYEPGTIAVLTGNVLQFYEADFENRYWILDDTMNFTLTDM